MPFSGCSYLAVVGVCACVEVRERRRRGAVRVVRAQGAAAREAHAVRRGHAAAYHQHAAALLCTTTQHLSLLHY